MFHRVKSEGQSPQANKPAQTTKPAQSAVAEKTIKPSTTVRMAQNAAVNAAQAATPAKSPAQSATYGSQGSSVARQSYVQKYAQKQSQMAIPAKMTPPAAPIAPQETAKPAAQAQVANKTEQTITETHNTNKTQTKTVEKETLMSSLAKTLSPKTPEATPYAGAKGNESRLTIGLGITMSGEIENCEHLLVEGTVEAALRGAQVLEISETGTFYGTVEIQEAEIAGQFEGELTAYDRLVVRSTGVITGSIYYREIEVEPGATIEGRLMPLPREAQASTAPNTSENKTREVRVADTTNLQPANTDQDLFTEQTANK